MADVADNAEQNRYEITVDETLAGIARYRLVEGGRVFDHTMIEPAFEDDGLGSELARAALDDVRARGIHIAATCPFIVRFLDENPEYQALVDPDLVT